MTVGDFGTVRADRRAEIKDDRHQNSSDDDLTDLVCNLRDGNQVHLGLRVIGDTVNKAVDCDLHNGVGHAGADVADTADDSLSRALKRECRECQQIEDSEERRSNHQPGTEFAPAGAGAVFDHTHHRIIYGIPDTGDEHDGGNGCRRQGHYICVEKHQIVVDHIETCIPARAADRVRDGRCKRQFCIFRGFIVFAHVSFLLSFLKRITPLFFPFCSLTQFTPRSYRYFRRFRAAARLLPEDRRKPQWEYRLGIWSRASAACRRRALPFQRRRRTSRQS